LKELDEVVPVACHIVGKMTTSNQMQDALVIVVGYILRENQDSERLRGVGNARENHRLIQHDVKCNTILILEPACDVTGACSKGLYSGLHVRAY
jgi:NADH:ubiquinone oxidoreductase subunit B-like Fe-S oxidoreductase